jgi:Leucine-rich repeat (LRR) protein
MRMEKRESYERHEERENPIKLDFRDLSKKEARTRLRDIISVSTDPIQRTNALRYLGELDEGSDFEFFEQLFLSDEDVTLRLASGELLRECYAHHERLISLFDYSLYNLENVVQKFLIIDLLNSLGEKRARIKIIKYLNRFFSKDEVKANPMLEKMINELDPDSDIPNLALELAHNAILHDHYVNKCRFHVALRDGFIIMLSCEGSGLQSIDSIQGLGNVSRLEHLLLQRNSITRIHGLEGLINLKRLDLSYNLITRIENMQSLINLEELNLSNNDIKEIENLDSMRLLLKLDLDHNHVKEINNLNELGQLLSLNLSYNEIREIEGLDVLKSLKQLYLSSNQINRVKGIDSLKDLMVLHLNANHIQKIEGLNALYSLKVLSLSENLIDKIENLDALHNLRKLELSKNNITSMEGLDDLIRLQELFLDKNQISEIKGVHNLNSLIILFLENNLIEDFDPQEIEQLESLNFLFLSNNPLNDKSRIAYRRICKFP